MTEQSVANLKKTSVPARIIWEADKGYIHLQQEKITLCVDFFIQYMVHCTYVASFTDIC